MGSWLYKPWDSRIPQFQTNPTSLVLNNMAVSGGKESSEPTFLSFKTAKLKWFGRAGLETQRQLGLFWVVFYLCFSRGSKCQHDPTCSSAKDLNQRTQWAYYES